MKIHLFDIPQDGKDYDWSNKTGELNSILSDLIGDKPYTAKAFIRPLNARDFEMSGSIKTEVPELCSRCGIDIPWGIDVSFKEIMIPAQPDDRTGKYARVNHLSDIHHDDGPSVVEYVPNGDFDMGEYLHEQVGLGIPFNPAPPEDKAGNCGLCKIPVRGKVFSFEDKMPVVRPNSPFEVLKSLKKE